MNNMTHPPSNYKKYQESNPDAKCDCDSCKKGEKALSDLKERTHPHHEGSWENNICSFCKKSKPVLRRYVRAGNKDLDDNKQNIFVIVYYCQDCGIEPDTAAQNDLREELVKKVEGMIPMRKSSFGGAALTPSKCSECGANFVANSTAGGLCNVCEARKQGRNSALSDILKIIKG